MAQAYILGLLRHDQILLKVHASYFQNEDFALYISRINEGMKESFYIWVGIYRRNLLTQNMT